MGGGIKTFAFKRLLPIFLFVAVLFASPPIFSQENQSAAPSGEDAILLDAGVATDNGVPEVISEASGIGVFVRMVVVLVIVIAVICAIFALMRKTMSPGSETDPFLRKVSSITLSPGKSVQIITLIDKAYLVGVSDNGVNLIGEVSDKELVDAMNVYADKTSRQRKPRNFNDVLSLFMPNGFKMKEAESADKTGAIYGDLASSTQDMFRKQRERLSGETGGDLS